MKNLARIFIALFFVLCFLPAGHAEIYTGTLSGTRSTAAGGGLISDDAWRNATGGVRLNFSVQQKSDSLWYYTYTFTNLNGQALTGSQFLKIEASNVTGASYYYASGSSQVPTTLITTDPGFHLWDAPASAPSYFAYDPHLKFGGNAAEARASAEVANQVRELSDGSIVIISSQAPMWGSFYLRGPSGSSNGPPEVLNRGFDGGAFPNPSGGTYSSVGSAPDFVLSNLNDAGNQYWILVPDSRKDLTTTPIPAAAWLFGSGLIGLIGIRRFRK